MTATLGMILGTALVSSGLTAVILILVVRLWGRRYLSMQLIEASDMMAVKLRTAVEEAADAVIPRIREQVEEGFGTAANEALPSFRAQLDEAAEAALPRFRKQVREGFKEALSDAVSGGVLEQAGEEIARKGGSILQTGLDLISGRQDERD